ncbi:30S ribosomal protein S8 [Candidatus Nomurabacteria bacterium]|nr:30S ribosomal protein S8 [Candidatus Nomurabacteria bacterium]
MVKDTIADLISNLKNAGDAGVATLTTPYSKIKVAILDLLEKEGFIKSYSKKGKKIAKFLEIEILYVDKRPAINGFQRMSTFSKRIYKGVKDIRPVKNGFGITVLTTPKGILTDKSARKEKVGGELLFKVW